MTPLAPPRRANPPFLSHLKRSWILGVLNLTPDSFYAPSRLATVAEAQACGARLIAEGADALDIGGESTRPGAGEVAIDEERRRVLPVIEALHAAYPTTPLSVDTRKSAIARAALARGATLINDISALRHDPDMAAVIAETGASVVLMHMQGTPETMQTDPRYNDVVEEVKQFFGERLEFAARSGIRQTQVLLDPGIGFGKSLEHNLTLLRRLREFTVFGCPLVIGVSRKSFVGRLGDAEKVRPVEERLEGSIAANLWAVQQGAVGLRVHDVGALRRALDAWQAFQS